MLYSESFGIKAQAALQTIHIQLPKDVRSWGAEMVARRAQHEEQVLWIAVELEQDGGGQIAVKIYSGEGTEGDCLALVFPAIQAGRLRDLLSCALLAAGELKDNSIA